MICRRSSGTLFVSDRAVTGSVIAGAASSEEAPATVPSLLATSGTFGLWSTVDPPSALGRPVSASTFGSAALATGRDAGSDLRGVEGLARVGQGCRLRAGLGDPLGELPHRLGRARRVAGGQILGGLAHAPGQVGVVRGDRARSLGQLLGQVAPRRG